MSKIKIRLRIIISSIIYLFLGSGLFAQTTGYSEDFSGSLKATAPPSFELSQELGILKVGINKQASVTWQGVDYPIHESIDISSKPIVNFKMRADKPFLLTLYIFDQYLVNSNRNIKIYPSEEFVDYFVDFSQVSSSLDLKTIRSLKFTPNGNSIDEFDANMFIDELSIGTDAEQIAGIGAIQNICVFKNSVSNKINLVDLVNTESVEITSEGGAITNVSISTIINNYASIMFSVKDGFIGIDTLIVKAKGIETFVDNIIQIPVFVEDNKPPYLNSIPSQIAASGDTLQIQLTGITDGNTTITQPVIISAESDNQAALPNENLVVNYIDGNSTAEIIYYCIQPAENITLTITVDDQYDYNNIYSTPININSYQKINNPPTIEPISNQYVYLEDGTGTLLLTNISDGDGGSQALSFEYSSSDTSVISNIGLNLDYQQGSVSANLTFIPKEIGKTTISLKIEDDGGDVDNNGDATLEIKFEIEVGNKPVNGHSADFKSFTNWGLNDSDGQQSYELGSFKDRDDVLKINLNNKSCWTGTMYFTPELNLENHRYLSYDIYFEGESFALAGVGGATHCYLYDDGWDADEDRNLPATHEQRKRVPADQWSSVVMDFRESGGLDNNNGGVINDSRIQKVLLNYASNFTWPFPIDNGTVYISNLKIGDAVPDGLLPSSDPRCTINPIPYQTIFSGAPQQTVKLSNLTNGKNDGIKPLVTATSSNIEFIPNPIISEVNSDGEAELTYLPSSSIGEATITVTVSAAGSQEKGTWFKINVVSDKISETVDIDLFPDSTYQTMRGFGAFEFSGQSHYSNFYTEELGASAVRIGIISNQIETVNDNNDPFSLNMSAFNHNAFDWSYFKKLKANGIETFILTSWSPPAWMKRNLSVDYGYAAAPNYEATDNILEPYFYEEFAESMVAVIKMFKDEANIDLYAIGIQNEPAFCEPYASAVLSPERFAQLVKIVGERFELEGIETKLYMPEQVFSQAHYSMIEYVNALIANPEGEQYTDIIATHAYAEDGIQPGQPSYPGWVNLWNKAKECENPKELWMSETFPECKSYDDAFSLAGAIHGALKYGNVSLWTLWSIEGTLLDLSSPLQSFYTSKNYYKFIRPGAKRVKAESAHEDIMVTSFVDHTNKMLTTVLLNKNTNPLTVRVLGRVDSIPANYKVYTTAKHINFEYKGEIGVNASLALPGLSVTTLVGKTDGEMVVKVNNEIIPNDYMLFQNFPNPFNPSTTIRYSLKNPGEVKISIYDILGRKVQQLVNDFQQAGRHEIHFEAGHLSSGVYFYRIISNYFIDVKKMLLLK